MLLNLIDTVHKTFSHAETPLTEFTAESSSLPATHTTTLTCTAGYPPVDSNTVGALQYRICMGDMNVQLILKYTLLYEHKIHLSLAFITHNTHNTIMMITITHMSVDDPNPPRKRPTSKDDIVDVPLLLLTCSCTPPTEIVAPVSDVSCEFMRLMRSVAVREPSSEE